MNADSAVDYLGPANVAMPQMAQTIALWGSAAVLAFEGKWTPD